jgi:hypothetical protein
VLNETSTTHSGLNVAYKAGTTKAAARTMALTASQNTQQGTYWMTIAGGPCFGGQTVLLTVGKAPYAGTPVTSQNVYP